MEASWAEYAWTVISSEKPALRRQPSTASWTRKLSGPGLVRDSIRPVAQRWRRRALRVAIARWRIAAFQSGESEEKSISPKTMSTMPSRRSSLLAVVTLRQDAAASADPGSLVLAGQ